MSVGDELLIAVSEALGLDTADAAGVLLVANTFDDCLVDGDRATFGVGGWLDCYDRFIHAESAPAARTIDE